MGSEIIHKHLRQNRGNALCYWKVITYLFIGSQMAFKWSLVRVLCSIK